MNRDECPERIRLTDEYCRVVTEFNVRKEVLARSPAQRNAEDWAAAEAARGLSETAWEAIQQHIAAHQCMPVTLEAIMVTDETIGRAVDDLFL